MQINGACKYAVFAMLSTVALATTARADSGYQPYYYTRDDMQFAKPSIPVQAPAAAMVNTGQLPPRPAMQFSNAPVAIPVSVQVPTISGPFPSDTVRAPVQFTNRPMAAQSNEAPAIIMRQPVEEDEAGPAMDMSAGLGW